MKTDIHISSFQKGDEVSIFKLFDMCFGKKMDSLFWQWRYAENPNGPAFIELAWDGDLLVSHYAVSPVTVIIDGHPEATGLAGATMTHPDYRGYRLFSKLGESVYRRMNECGVKMVWGFPNNNIHRSRVQNLNWKDIYEIPFFRRQAQPKDKALFVYDNSMELTPADESIDELWKSASASMDVAVARTSAYFKWRYLDNPAEDYRVFACKPQARLLGVAVAKNYNGEIQIVDILEAHHSGAAVNLVKTIIGYAAACGCRSVALWCNVHHRLHGDLEKLGFVNDRPITYFGVRPISSDLHVKKASNYASWYISMSDSDNF